MGDVELKVGDPVKKVGGDYVFDGVVVSVFKNLGGEMRYVVENYQGILHIFKASNLERRT